MRGKEILIKNNILSGFARMLVSVLLPFILRTVIIRVLGAEYLGLNSLFTSILSVLSLAELGFSNAIIYSMYKPLANNNEDVVCSLLLYYKKVYRNIGIVLLGIGVCLTPFVTLFIGGEWPSDINIYLLFLIYLFNISISYFFFAYKSALLNALQRIDVVNWTQMIVLLLQYLAQLCVLFIFKNYYVYIIFTPLCTIICNLLIARYANKHYPQYQCKGVIDHNAKKCIKQKIKGLIIYKISETARNSSDTIVLSTFMGLITVAVFNNYYYIFCAAYSIMVAINQGIQASVGHSIATESIKNNLEDLRKYNFRIMWLVTWFTCCLICLYQPFVSLFFGKTMLLSTKCMILFGIYFYVLNMNNVRNLYFDGCGLWLEGKWSFLFEALCNLLLNIFLGKIYGIAGVIISTILTIFIFNFIWRTIIVFRYYFGESLRVFIQDHFTYFTVSVIVCSTTFLLCDKILISENLLFQLIIKLGICAILPNVLMILIYYKKLRNLSKKSIMNSL